MKNIRYIFIFIISFLICSVSAYLLSGLTFETRSSAFKLLLFSLIASFIITVVYWIFQQKEHPRGLIVLFFTEMWERFSYYGMRGLLMLYLTKSFIEGGLGFSDSNAGLIYGTYTGLVYLTPVFGGIIADKYLGQRKAITLGGILMMLGQFMLASSQTLPVFYSGLILLIIGNGFFKPNISVIVGNLYSPQDTRKDSAFTIFYMGINLGAFFAPLICGLLAEDILTTPLTLANGVLSKNYAFRYGFLAAGIGMMIGQIIYNTLAPKYLGNIGMKPNRPEKLTHTNETNKSKTITSKAERDRVTLILIMAAFIIFFWAGFEQAGSSLTLYTDKYINRTVCDFELPTSWFQSINPLFIVILAPLFSFLWTFLDKKGKEPNIPVKMSIGMILLGIGFICMTGAVYERGGDIQDSRIKANLLWMIGTYFLHTCGELCLSPIGLSMVTKLSPARLASMLMGVWFLSSFIANFLSGFVVRYFQTLGALSIFNSIAIFTIVLGIIMLLLSKRLFGMMHTNQP